MRAQTNPLSAAASLAIRLYQVSVSPFLTPRCRFLPTCSDYAREALTEHGPLAGGRLALWRLCRCHPWGGSGYDPVPLARPRGQAVTPVKGREA